MGFTKWNTSFRLHGTFRPGNQDYLFKRSFAPGNLPLKRPEKSCSIYFPTVFSGNFLSTPIVSAQVTITINVARLLACVAGVQKGRGRELGSETARGRREEIPFLSPSRAQSPASPFNACHAGYTLASIYYFNNHLSSKEISSHRKEFKEGRGHGG